MGDQSKRNLRQRVEKLEEAYNKNKNEREALVALLGSAKQQYGV